QPLQPPQLALVHHRIVAGVVANEDLREIRVELQNVGAEIVAVLEVKLVLTRLLDRHRKLQPRRTGALRNIPAELLIDQHTSSAPLRAAANRLDHPLVDQMLRVGDRRGLLGRRIALDPEHLLLERATMIERQDVEGAYVTKLLHFVPHFHPNKTPRRSNSSVGTLRTSATASASGTSLISLPRSEVIIPHSSSCAALIAARPSLVASTRSNAVGVPPRCTWPRTVARVSYPVRCSISCSRRAPIPPSRG